MDRLAPLWRTISRKHLLASAAAFFSIFLLLFLYMFSPSHSESSSYADFYDITPSDDCILDVDILRSYELLNQSTTVEYARLVVNVDRDSPPYERFKDSLFVPRPRFQDISLEEDAGEGRGESESKSKRSRFLQRYALLGRLMYELPPCRPLSPMPNISSLDSRLHSKDWRNPWMPLHTGRVGHIPI